MLSVTECRVLNAERCLIINALPASRPHPSCAGARFYMTDKRIVLTTTSSVEEGKKIAQALVERRLAACVNIIPKIESVYRWEGKIEEAKEVLLLIKTTERAFARLRDAICELHSYQVPECISLNVDDGTAPYLQWIEESVE
jgi:periplasmic divalent cation tolerance protein